MKKLATLLMISLLLGIHPTFAAATATDELAQLLTNTHTLQATFTQSLANRQGKPIGAKTTGKMALERPGKLRWETITPNPQLIIINNNQTLLYDPDLAQLIKRKADYHQPGNPATLLSSSIEYLKQSFQIVALKPVGQTKWFKLTPKTSKKEQMYQWIKIGFVDDRLTTMYILDNLEQTTLINFSRITLNAKLLPKIFNFTPPPDTEIFNGG